MRTWQIILIPILVGLVLRVLFLVQNWDSPFFLAPLVDAKDFHDKAVLLATGEGLPERPFARPPLFMYFAGLLYRLFTTDMRVVIIAHQVLGLLTIGLTAWIGVRLLGPVPGFVGALVLALARLPLVLEGQLLNETLQTFLLTAMFALVVGARDRRGAMLPILAAAAGALAILTRPTSVFFVVPALGILIALQRGRWGTIAATVLVFVVISGSAAVRNRVVGGEWVAVSYNGGINFLVGNGRQHDELMNVRPGLRWERLMQSPRALEQTGVFRLDPWVRGYRAWDRRYYDAAFADIGADPGAALKRIDRKLCQFWSHLEVDRNVTPEAFITPGSLLYFVTIPFFIIGPPALAGLLLLLWGGPRGRCLIVGSVAAVWLTCTIFFVTSRYRMPAYPGMTLALGYWVAAALAVLQDPARPRGRALVIGGLLGLTVLFSLADPGSARRIAPSRGAYLRAVALERTGDARGALTAFQEAVAVYPDDPDVLFSPTSLLLRSGQPHEAAALATRAAAALPDHPSPWFNLGLAYSFMERYEDAARAFARLVEVKPSDARGHYQLGRSLVSAGRPEAAILPLTRSIQMAPAMPLPRLEMARAYALMGREGEAIRTLRDAVRLDPGIVHLARQVPELTGAMRALTGE